MKVYKLLFILAFFIIFSSTTFAGRIQDFNSYLTQIEEISNSHIIERECLIKYFKEKEYKDNENKKVKLLEINGDDLKLKHNEFKRKKETLIKEWTEKTGIDWPKYNSTTECIVNGTCIKKNANYRYDAHHIIPQSYNGPNEWWNLIPLDTKQHNLIHGKNIIIDIPAYTVDYKKFTDSVIEDNVIKVERILKPAYCCNLFQRSCLNVRD